MESVKFWYTFTDETGDQANLDYDLGISKEDGVSLEDVCETFIKFLELMGFSPARAREYFPTEMELD